MQEQQRVRNAVVCFVAEFPPQIFSAALTGADYQAQYSIHLSLGQRLLVLQEFGEFPKRHMSSRDLGQTKDCEQPSSLLWGSVDASAGTITTKITEQIPHQS